MIGHQDIGMHGKPMFLACSKQAIEVEDEILFRGEGRLAVVAALDDVLDFSLCERACQAGHGGFLG
jgi:hypothetical protein